MSRRLEEGLINLGELDDLAIDIAGFMKDRGISSAMAANASLFLYAKCVVLHDGDEEQAIEAFRAVLKQLRALRPS